MQELVPNAHRQLGLQLTRSQLTALSLYERELVDWNTRFNLTAIRDPQEIHIKHFLDSLTCLLALCESPLDHVIDVGTGAGFPGIPIRILYPKMQLTLVESVGKKAQFCRHVVNILDLQGVDVVQDRAENLGQNPAADRLLVNMLRYAARGLDKPLADLPADFDAQLKTLGC